ncbi:unnamed protein product, partial [Oikopleura dioica]
LLKLFIYNSIDYNTAISGWTYTHEDASSHKCIDADVLSIQMTFDAASAFNFTMHVKTQYSDGFSSTGAITKDVNSKCENCLCASPDCSAKATSTISIGVDGNLAGGVDLACQNGVCYFLLSHTLISYGDEQLFFCEQTEQSLLKSTNFELFSTAAEKSMRLRVYESFKPAVVSNVNSYGFCEYPDLTAACPEFEFTCDAGVEIDMDLLCFKRKYPALELSNFLNRASPSNSTKLFTETQSKFLTVLSDSSIIYSWNFEYLSPLILLGFENIDLSYTFNCSFQIDEILVMNGTIEPPVTVSDITFNPDPIADKPDIFINNEPYDDDAAPIVKSSDIMTFDFSQVFSDLGEYRIDSCEVKSEDSSQSSPIITNGCATTVFQYFVTVDQFGQFIKTPPIVFPSSPDFFSVECNLIFCDDCVNTASSCPSQGNSEIITVQVVRSMTSSEAEKRSASISASLSEADLIEVQTHKTAILVDRKFKHLLSASESNSEPFLTSLNLIFLTFLSFLV